MQWEGLRCFRQQVASDLLTTFPASRKITGPNYILLFHVYFHGLASLTFRPTCIAAQSPLEAQFSLAQGPDSVHHYGWWEEKFSVFPPYSFPEPKQLQLVLCALLEKPAHTPSVYVQPPLPTHHLKPLSGHAMVPIPIVPRLAWKQFFSAVLAEDA